MLDITAQDGDLAAGYRIPKADVALAGAVRRDPLSIGTDHQLDNLTLVVSQHGDPPARRCVVQANLAIQADNESPTIRCENRGDLRCGPSENRDGPARLGVPQTTDLLIQ